MAASCHRSLARPFITLQLAPTPLSRPSLCVLQRIGEAHSLWLEHSRTVLEQGGRMADELEDVLAEAEQYLWGGKYYKNKSSAVGLWALLVVGCWDVTSIGGHG